MKGKELKEILIREGISLSELSRLLGFANDQRLHSALKAEDVKSGLIESIARVTNKNVGFFYTRDTDCQVRTGEGGMLVGQPSEATTVALPASPSCKTAEERISELERQNAVLTRSLDLLTRQLEALLERQQDG